MEMLKNLKGPPSPFWSKKGQNLVFCPGRPRKCRIKHPGKIKIT